MKKYDAPGNLHPAQMAILRELLHLRSSNFSSSQKATGLTSDHANFHIKKLITNGYVEHVPKSYGEYRLTKAGKTYAGRMDLSTSAFKVGPKLSVLLNIRNTAGKWLRQERLKHPYYGYWTRPGGKIHYGEQILQAAARKLLDETGLTADLTISKVEHRIDKDEQGAILDDKYLFTIDGTSPRGTLLIETPFARNYWMTEEQYANVAKRFARPVAATVMNDNLKIPFTEGEYTFDVDDF